MNIDPFDLVQSYTALFFQVNMILSKGRRCGKTSFSRHDLIDDFMRKASVLIKRVAVGLLQKGKSFSFLTS